MDRIYLGMICASVLLLATAIGLASPRIDGAHQPEQLPLLLRTIPR